MPMNPIYVKYLKIYQQKIWEMASWLASEIRDISDPKIILWEGAKKSSLIVYISLL